MNRGLLPHSFMTIMDRGTRFTNYYVLEFAFLRDTDNGSCDPPRGVREYLHLGV